MCHIKTKLCFTHPHICKAMYAKVKTVYPGTCWHYNIGLGHLGPSCQPGERLLSPPPLGSSSPPLSFLNLKAAGPGGIPGTVIKACADQLAGILTKLFNLSLTHATVPTCLKASTIVPIPKKPAIDSLND